MYSYSKEDIKNMITFFNKNTLTRFEKRDVSKITEVFNTQLYRTGNYTLPKYKQKLVDNLISCFKTNKTKISKRSQETFWHELGHVYEALLNGFDYTLIVLVDRCRNKHHLFFYKNNLIKYATIKYQKVNGKGISWFQGININPMTWKIIATGGFKQEFVRNKRNKYSILNSFARIPLCRNYEKSNDASFILGDKDFKKINSDFKLIHEYLYSKNLRTTIDYTSLTPFPIEKYRKVIQECISSCTT
ncbi:hypothetical protein [Enterococcus casseliflavus]|uniref:hypothetical protein n=1 Tax=Enterococcus casseliflavus TaxID=37734 RepID=UPI001E4B1B45|nr:hypothetical protein [Enterococcus casseliflavus]MCD4963387.1 hypothetical protein [Enterococcus casseliflavus]